MFLNFLGHGGFCRIIRVGDLTPIPVELIVHTAGNHMQMCMHHHLPGGCPVCQVQIVGIIGIQPLEGNRLLVSTMDGIVTVLEY